MNGNELSDWPRPWRPSDDDHPGDEEIWFNTGAGS